MNASGRDAIWARLREGALVEGDLPARSTARSPWYVRLMLGIAGWIGAMFLFGFVGAAFVFVMENAFASIALGAVVCAGAAFVFRSDPEGDFLAQFGLAVSFAGQLLIFYGLGKWYGFRAVEMLALTMAAVQGVLFVLVRNFLHRVWTAWTGAFALALALGEFRLFAFAPAFATAAFAWVWLKEFEYPHRSALVRSGGYGLALAAVLTAVMHGDLWMAWLAGRGRGPLGGETGLWLGAALSGVVLLWGVIMLLRRESVALSSGPGRVALAGAVILALASLKAPGVAPAAAILVIGYANGNRVLAGFGIFALLGYLSHYYYALHATLLEKSMLLVCTGLALLAARFALHRFWPASGAKEAVHA